VDVIREQQQQATDEHGKKDGSHRSDIEFSFHCVDLICCSTAHPTVFEIVRSAGVLFNNSSLGKKVAKGAQGPTGRSIPIRVPPWLLLLVALSLTDEAPERRGLLD
jgi:hypothetical protein